MPSGIAGRNNDKDPRNNAPAAARNSADRTRGKNARATFAPTSTAGMDAVPVGTKSAMNAEQWDISPRRQDAKAPNAIGGDADMIRHPTAPIYQTGNEPRRVLSEVTATYGRRMTRLPPFLANRARPNRKSSTTTVPLFATLV